LIAEYARSPGRAYFLDVIEVVAKLKFCNNNRYIQGEKE
jgi:hypothetical protein